MSSSEAPRLGWIGLGSMGQAMALNMQKYLAANNYPSLQYTNRTMSRGAPLQEIGAVPGEKVEDLAQSCDIIFISLSDDAALTQTITTLLSSKAPLTNKIVVDTTTIQPDTSTTISQQLSSAGASFISAPVFGATPIAQAGRLLIAVAGPPAAIAQIQPFLKGVLARDVIHVSAESGKALLLKTTSNFLTAGLHLLLSEAHVFAEKSGLPAPVLEQLVEQNFGAYVHSVSKRLTEGHYCPPVGARPMSGLDLGIKDVGIGVGVAREEGMRLDIGEMVLGLMGEAKQWGENEGRGRQLDSTSLFGVVRERAGLEFRSEVVRKKDGES